MPCNTLGAHPLRRSDVATAFAPAIAPAPRLCAAPFGVERGGAEGDGESWLNQRQGNTAPDEARKERRHFAAGTRWGGKIEEMTSDNDSPRPSSSRKEEFPLVSIVTPSFNQALFLEETILSVLGQEYPHVEYLIVDGGSTDGSLEIIRRYADRLAWWVSEADRGQTDAINKGFAHAKGEILAWLNSDDTYLPQAVAEAVAYLTNHPEVGLVYGDANFIDEKGRVLGKFPARQTDYRRLRQGYVHIPQQAAFFRAELWRKVGPLDTSFYFAMDYDLWVRIARLSKIVYVPRLWANFRLHGSAKTIAADERCWPEMLRVHYRDGGTPFALIVWKSRLRKLVAPYLQWKRRRLLHRYAEERG